MSTRSRSAPPPEDDLRLPRTPGLVRRFWARHPLLADALIALSCLFLTLAPASTLRGPGSSATVHPATVPLVALAVVCCALLLRRRQWPVAVFTASIVLGAVALLAPLSLGSALLLFSSYALAVYRSARAAWTGFGLGMGVLAVVATVAWLSGATSLMEALNALIGEVGVGLIGTLVGVNVGNRKRYVEAIIERSRQLLRERDQQGEIAAAAERARIAREMHDIVSHSLTVIVALTEGAAATADADRAHAATLQASQTARAALREMRGMLGVLRSGDDVDAPLLPADEDAVATAIEAARTAGFPVTARITTQGTPVAELPRTVRFAVGRIVQEGLTNAMRHAPSATTIVVTVEVGVDRVEVDVRNDGVHGNPGSGGYGLRGLRERVELAGGRLDVSAADGTWSLRASLPLSAGPELDTPLEGADPR